jgi:hypothetical protein
LLLLVVSGAIIIVILVICCALCMKLGLLYGRAESASFAVLSMEVALYTRDCKIVRCSKRPELSPPAKEAYAMACGDKDSSIAN